MVEQTIWLAPKAISFTAVCAECADEHGFFAARVEGRLELERAHSSTTCGRGHPIRIERANREPIGVLAC
ncbi:MAG: hypothetical protein MSC30_08730 [Gaiellaceae bacterium MAG52_C11]|nr:hypothetical protein [Candidatus Gaiellasilicea maunaloa]